MLGIILINYNSEKELVHYVKNELVKIGYPHIIAIVNNSHSLSSKNTLSKSFINDPKFQLDKNIFIIDAASNLGYAKANNLGAMFLADRFNIEYLLFTNSDIILSDKDVVDSLISKAETDEKIGVIGPRIVGENGKDQSPIMFIPPIKYLAKYLIKPMINKTIKKSRHTSSDNTFKTLQEGFYYTVSGCFMLVKASVFLGKPCSPASNRKPLPAPICHL